MTSATHSVLRDRNPWLVRGFGALVAFSLVRVLSDADELTSSGTVGAAMRLAIPIGFAGLGGLFSERAGVVNIGLEGMMILGTWFGAWGAWQFGPWQGLALGIVGGMIGGAVHALATVTFNVDHIISGVALNLMAFGLARYLSVLAYDQDSGGGATQSPRRSGEVTTIDVPLLSDGTKWLAKKGWFLVSDAAGVAGAFVTNISMATALAAVLVVVAWFVLWRTRFGLRLRSCGENPHAAESLGVRVVRIKYAAVLISGACAGFGGAFLAVVQSSLYREGQTAGRGYIGLATMIFGNWRPGGLTAGALLFGYADALQLRASDEVPALFGLVAIGLLGAAVWAARGRPPRMRVAVGATLGAAVALWLFAAVDSLPGSVTYMTPYLVTLAVLATASQKLRPPAAVGRPYRRGEEH